MHSYLLAIDLPSPLKQQLHQLHCYGLPQVDWIEENNLHIALRFLGPLSDPLLFKIEDCLEAMAWAPFQASIHGLDYAQTKGGRGSLWAGVQPKQAFIKLKKEIDLNLKSFNQLPIERLFEPQILLGKYENLSMAKLQDYLAYHGIYELPSFEISSFSLFQIQSSPKHVFYQPIKKYSSSHE